MAAEKKRDRGVAEEPAKRKKGKKASLIRIGFRGRNGPKRTGLKVQFKSQQSHICPHHCHQLISFPLSNVFIDCKCILVMAIFRAFFLFSFLALSLPPPPSAAADSHRQRTQRQAQLSLSLLDCAQLFRSVTLSASATVAASWAQTTVSRLLLPSSLTPLTSSLLCCVCSGSSS